MTIAPVIGDWDDASLQTKPVHCLPYNPDSSGIGRLSIPRHTIYITYTPHHIYLNRTYHTRYGIHLSMIECNLWPHCGMVWWTVVGYDMVWSSEGVAYMWYGVVYDGMIIPLSMTDGHQRPAGPRFRVIPSKPRSNLAQPSPQAPHGLNEPITVLMASAISNLDTSADK